MKIFCYCRDAPPGQSCQAAVQELIKLSNEVQQNPSVILPYIELKLTVFELQRKDIQLHESGKLLHSVKHKINDTPNFEEEFDKVFEYKELQEKKQEFLKKLSDKSLANYSEYESRISVLRELKYIDNEDRGKTMCFLLTTFFIFHLNQ